MFLGRKDRVDGTPAFVAVCDLLHRRGIAGATVLLGVDGTAHGHRQRAQFFGRNANVPLMVLAVGAGPQITAVLPELGTLVNRPLITLERVRICKRDGMLINPPQQLPGRDDQGLALWQKLTIFTSEGALHNGQPIHRAITRALRAHGSSGATSLRDWGFHGDHPPAGTHRASSAAGCPPSPWSSTPRKSAKRSGSSTPSPTTVAWSPANSCPPPTAPRHTAVMAG